jgi:hypothetical protein
MTWLKFTTERGFKGESLKEILINPAKIQSIRPCFNEPEICEIIFNNTNPAEDFYDSLTVFHTFDEIQQVLRYCGDHIIGIDAISQFLKEPHNETAPSNF